MITPAQDTSDHQKPQLPAAKQDLIARLAEINEKEFIVLYCSVCGELIRLTTTKHTCKNDCITKEPPIENIYRPKTASYNLDFCITDEDGNYHFKPMKCAQFIKTNYLFKTDYSSGILYFYNPKTHRWTTDGETYLREILGQQLNIEYKTSSYNNILDALKSITYDNVEFGRKIAFKNGLLDVTTGILTSFTPNEMPFYSIPVEYNPQAKSIIWENFVSQIVTKEDAQLLQEWSGYLLYPGYPKHKFIFMYGVGRNGKGVWARTMRGILGKENCFSLRLEELNGDHRFVISRLYGKLFCECSEPLTNKMLQTPILKALTGADNQDSEVKGIQKTIGFVNEAKITIFGNKYPRVNDNTDGFYERFEILEFPNQFTGENQKDELEKVWLDSENEKSGIVNWMLEGLKRLLEQGKFTTSKTQQEKLIELKRLSDPTGAFIEEKCSFNPKSYITRKKLHEAYIEYCEEIGATPDKDSPYTQRIKNTPKIKPVFKKIDGVTERIWEGIALKSGEESQKKISGLDNYNPDTTDTLDTPRTPSHIFHNQKNRESIEGVSGVSPVSPDEKSTKINIVKTQHYHLIPPNQPEPCDSYNCACEAKYNIDGSGNFCCSHFEAVRKNSKENGFDLVLDAPEPQTGEF